MLREEFLEHSEVFDEPLYLEDELYHFGILGMRHGHRNGPPYPLGKEAHSASEKKHKWWESLHAHHKAKKKKKQQKQALEKARKTKAKNKENAEYRQKLMESGTREELIENRSGKKVKKGQRLSDAELHAALNRLEAQNTLNARLNKLEPTPKLDRYSEMAKNVDKFVIGSKQFINAYNLGAGVFNAVQEYKKSDKRLPQIRSGYNG